MITVSRFVLCSSESSDNEAVATLRANTPQELLPPGHAVRHRLTYQTRNNSSQPRLQVFPRYYLIVDVEYTVHEYFYIYRNFKYVRKIYTGPMDCKGHREKQQRTTVQFEREESYSHVSSAAVLDYLLAFPQQGVGPDDL